MTEKTQSFIANAETAFANKQYSVALEWYQKALAETPDDLYLLSRAGSICVPLGKFKEALEFFGHAKELNPNNGDVLFNYANACFFNHDYVAAFENYVAAERAGCSDEVTPRLYYQLALICSLRQDTKSALIYFKKCEEADRGGLIALNPDMISEKLKLYMMEEDFAKAAECADQLVAIAPIEFKNYMVLFSILMANKQYVKAEKVLHDAENYAEMSDEETNALQIQIAALYIAQAEENSSETETLIKKAIDLLEAQLQKESLDDESYSQIVFALSEAYIKARRTDDAIDLLTKFVVNPNSYKTEDTDQVLSPMMPLAESQIERMAEEDMATMQKLIDTGALTEDLGASLPLTYDEYGNKVRYYGDVLDYFMPQNGNPPDIKSTPEMGDLHRELSVETKDKVLFSLLTCYLDKEDFEKSYKTANVLKHSANKYYSYFGIYTETFAYSKISKNKDSIEKKYAETIAYFKSKMFADATDSLAVVFRTRLYAERGKYAQAEEISRLLSDSDQIALKNYIEQCKSED